VRSKAARAGGMMMVMMGARLARRAWGMGRCR